MAVYIIRANSLETSILKRNKVLRSLADYYVKGDAWKNIKSCLLLKLFGITFNFLS